MGIEYFKRPLRTVAGRGTAFGAKGDVRAGRSQFDELTALVTSATSVGTLGPRAVVALNSTSTGAPDVYTLAAPSTGGGDFFSVTVEALGSSSDAPQHINASSSNVTFDGANDMLVLSTAGAGASMYSLSSSRWLIIGNFNATFAAST